MLVDSTRVHPDHAREKAILVALDRPGRSGSLTDRVAELTELADTANCDVVAVSTQARAKPDVRTYIGKGKVEEVKELIEETEADVIIVDDALAPAQARNLEEGAGRTVIDRTQLILDIFARRASTRLARWEVELAQLEYELPRYRRMWTHLSRIEGGVGMRGPGETQLEVDRRRARERIGFLKDRIADAKRQKEVASSQREALFCVALCGYTNVGKSTLLQALTGAETFIEDRLFATLDATTRRLEIDGETVLLTDTVGFIRDLPHGLVASFHATLSEVMEADLLLHVCDITSHELPEQIAAVEGVLQDIAAESIPTLKVFNKVDALPAEVDAEAVAGRYGGGVCCSATDGQGLDALRAEVVTRSRSRFVEVSYLVPYADGRTMAYLEANAKIVSREFEPAGTRVIARVSPADAGRLRQFAARSAPEA